MTSDNNMSMIISYAQLIAFDSSLERPFNLWTKRHVAQGFAWRPGSVSFRTVEESGPHLVTCKVDTLRDDIPASAIRAIEVPFAVKSDKGIEIASISESKSIDVPSGTYQLRFECYGPGGDGLPLIQLIFFKTDEPTFRIVKADSGLSSKRDLLLTADPA